MKRIHVLSCILALCWMQTGFCLVKVTIPNSGDNIVGDVGDENIALFCELTQDGMEQATVWSLMVEGWTGQSTINRGDPGFNITGEPIPDNPGFFFNTNLTILNLTAELNNTVIYCGVPDNLLAANFRIRLYTPPSLVDRGVVGLSEGDVASVDLSDPTAAEALPLPEGGQFLWRMGGSVVSSDSRVTYGYPSVMFNAVERGDAGDYTLSATNTRPNGSEIGNDTGSFTLDVYFGPSIVAGDDRVPVAEGGIVTLSCGTDPTGNPEPFVDWVDNNGTVVPDGGRYSIVNDGSQVSLTIQDVTASDAGDWQCILTVEVVEVNNTSIIGDPVIRNITLFVVVPPSTPTAVNEQGIDGTSVLVCWHVTADIGTAGITRYRVFVDPADVDQPIDTPDNETFFNVTGLLPATEYQFRVQAVSEYEGVVVTSGVSDPPANATTGTSVPAPVCDTAPVSANGVITVTWDYTHTGGLNLTEVIVQYGVYSAEEIDFQDIPDGNLTDVDQMTLDVEGLLAGQAYVFQITATNDIGSVTVQCPPVVHLVGVPQTPVVNSIEPTDAGDGAIFVNVEIPAVDGFDIPPGSVTFTVIATLQPDGTMTTVPVTVNNYSYGDEVMVMVSGLVVGREYDFTVSASNVFGGSETSEVFLMNVPDSTTPTTMPTTEAPDEGDGIIGGVVGGTVGGVLVLIVAVIASIIVVTILKKQRTGQMHPADLPQKEEPNVDLPLTANTAYNIVDFSGCKSDPPVSQNVAYHTTQRQDDSVAEEALYEVV